MSKRNPAQDDGPRPASGLVPRLRDVRIRSKLALLLVVPVIALVTLGAARLAGNASTYASASRLRSLVQTGKAAADLIDDLQTERSAAVSLLGDFSHGKDEFQHKVDLTDDTYDELQRNRDTVSSMPDALRGPLSRVDSEFRTLGELRTQVAARKEITTSDTSFRYRTVIADLLDYRNGVASYTSSTDLGGQIRAATALVEAKEYVAQEQIDVLRSLTTGQFAPAQVKSFASELTGYTTSLQDFTDTADPGLSSLYQQTLIGADVSQASAMETVVNRTIAGNTLHVSGKDWNVAMAGRLRLMQKVDEHAESSVIDAVSASRDTQAQQLIIESSSIMVAMLLAILFALLIARSMSGSLRRLREGALSVAYQGLPTAVAQMQRSDAIGEQTAEQVASRVESPIRVRGRDEIGQVSEAFNVVHREAVRVAAEQAVLRASVSTMFVNLARRSQLLVDRLIGHLDRLEQGEEDPDRLAQLFQLDHLATRMRRNDENLLVLAGADSTRARREAAALGDVLRAAQSEVEQYTRIEFGVVDRDVEVEATAVNDVVHLVAELLDNATSFSAPDSAVVVDARRVGDRAIVQIEDRGIGMSSDVLDEVNERLAAPPLVDVAVSRMMGLVVVGRLASRLGIRIELRPARQRGTVADVEIPASILVPLRRGDRRPAALPAPPQPVAAVGAQPESLTTTAVLSPIRDDDHRPEPRRDRPTEHPDTGTSRRELTDVPRRPRPAPAASAAPAEVPAQVRQSSGSLFDLPPASTERWAAAAAADRGEDRSDHAPAAQQPTAEPAQGFAAAGARSGPESRPAAQNEMPDRSGELTVQTPQVAPPSRAGRRQRAGASGGSSRELNPAALLSVDETMELPIFREVESAWFHTSPSRPRETAASAAPVATQPVSRPLRGNATPDTDVRRPDRPATAGDDGTGAEPARRADSDSARPAPGGWSGGGQAGDRARTMAALHQRRSTPAAAQRDEAPADNGDGRARSDMWQSAADKGWRAASAAVPPAGPAETTGSGLPKRRPMAQLVPGGVEDVAEPVRVRERSPDAVRGLLTAYHRGVQRGRNNASPQGSPAAGYNRNNGEEQG